MTLFKFNNDIDEDDDDDDDEKIQRNHHAVQMDNLNCFQYIFFTWMTPLIRKIFLQKILPSNLNQCSPFDSCNLNSIRLIRFWQQQSERNGSFENVSLLSTLFRFFRTRFIMTCLVYILCLATGYLSSTFFVKKLLEELEAIIMIETIDVKIVDHNTNKSIIVNYGVHNISGSFKWIVALYLCEFCRAISFSIMFAISIRTGIRCVNAMNGIIYHKIMTKNQYGHYTKMTTTTTTTPATMTNIQPNNLFANDIWKVYQMIYMSPLMIGSPIIIIVTIIYTYLLIDTSAFYGISLFIIIFLLQFIIIKRQTILRNRLMKQTDYRLLLINQLVKFSRTIKFHGWEQPFQNEIQHCRSAECSIIRRYQFLQCLSTSLALLAPMLITIINILVHTWLGNDLTVSTAFSLIMLNYIAAHGIRSLPNYFREIVNGRVALKRAEKFLKQDDHKSNIINNNEMIDNQNAIEMIKCSFIWTGQNGEHSSSLTDITLSIAKKNHVCLYGPVGSGKTALLLSIMGQTQCSKGEIRLFSQKIAYVSQKPWLQNSTIKENILFELPMNQKRYYETLMKCSLIEDISLFADGDDTVIGENGVKLSGGQKQRIALARAVYSDSDIYLIDDCFSSLDSRVVKAIFNNIINGILRHKTIIFITKNLYLLNDDDFVVIMNNGKIEQFEKHSKLLQTSNEYCLCLENSKISNNNDQHSKLSEIIDQQDDDENCCSDDSDLDSDSLDKILYQQQQQQQQSNNDNQNGIRKLSTKNSYDSLKSLMAQYDNDDDIESNGKYNAKTKSKTTKNLNKFHKKTISWSVYKTYIQSSGGYFCFALMIIIFIMQTATSTFSNWWLSYWLNQGSGSGSLLLQNGTTTIDETSIIINPNLRLYQSIYLISFIIVIFTSLIMAIMFVRIITIAANTLHNRILAKIIYSPIIFFDTIKAGKIINLFSHNMDELDNQLPVALDGFLQRLLIVIGNFIIIISMLYWFTIPFIFFIILFYLIFRYYRKAMYWLKQADMCLRSPIYSFVNNTIDGLATIKAFGMERKFEENFHTICDQQIVAFYYYQCAIRWLSIRIDCLCILASLCITILVIFNLNYIGSAYAGLLITQSLQLSGLLQFVIRLALELETRLVSVERINTYTDLIKVEKSIHHKLESNDDQNLKQLLMANGGEWPSKKRISFRQVSLRYRQHSPLVLDSVSFDINGGEKFAIIGRTGAGKSSITYALFRLIEICSGSIYIDNIDIQTISLKHLRSKLSIIPQDPVIFQRTVRKNLDPLLRIKDEQLWQVLEQVMLKDKILSFENGLNEMINEDKFSTGEKQLLCLARALLHRNKIIILDEATSSMDDRTENNIWNIIQKNFNDCTIILIAHRLKTVLKCDQLIVLQNGKVIEQGNPIELQQNSNSYFFKMISKA
ncbi:ATP-binding cassette sub-family C member 12-like isoform X2 [Dermatophagoides pteronyssinus]|uniref:ATP-binding cassette sub-family C member 12-like isoform X2 n=1 Tax=Dermatophagoides pteronyssinus TaxID=6956 RepID=UPI003F667AA3